MRQPSQELEAIPVEFDSREVLSGRSKQSVCFVIKDVGQILPYCVINFTRGLHTNRPAPLMSPSHAGPSASGMNSSTTRVHTYAPVLSLSGPALAGPTAGSSTAGASATTTFLPFHPSAVASFKRMNQPVPSVPGQPSAGPSNAGSSAVTHSSPASLPWPPLSVSFLPGRHCAIRKTPSGGIGGINVRGTPNMMTMMNSQQFKEKLDTNLKKVVECQMYVINKLQSRPDLVSNARLKKLFLILQHADVICYPDEVINKCVAKVKKFF